MAESSWTPFAMALECVKSSTYGVGVPRQPRGAPNLRRLVGNKKVNCTLFTAYLLAQGFEQQFSMERWQRWQVSKERVLEDSSRIQAVSEDYPTGFAPQVAAEWGIATLVEGRPILPREGVYLIQTFTKWPRGHSWLVLDYDEPTGRILTLEANMSRGLDGVGFAHLGNMRTTSPTQWRDRVGPTRTWQARIRDCAEVHMARLHIDHGAVLDWIATPPQAPVLLDGTNRMPSGWKLA